jgi:hypothetical protein
MIEVTSSNSLLINFLSKYPDHLKNLCAEAIMIYGVQTIKKKFPYGLSTNQLISVAGISEENSFKNVPSSCNISIGNNKSVEVNKYLSDSIVGTDDKNLRSKDNQSDIWSKADKRALKRRESERKITFSNDLKEPETCTYEIAQKIFTGSQNEEFGREKEVMKIAENFLRTSYATHLAQKPATDIKKNKLYTNKSKFK